MTNKPEVAIETTSGPKLAIAFESGDGYRPIATTNSGRVALWRGAQADD